MVWRSPAKRAMKKFDHQSQLCIRRIPTQLASASAHDRHVANLVTPGKVNSLENSTAVGVRSSWRTVKCQRHPQHRTHHGELELRCPDTERDTTHPRAVPSILPDPLGRRFACRQNAANIEPTCVNVAQSTFSRPHKRAAVAFRIGCRLAPHEVIWGVGPTVQCLI